MKAKIHCILDKYSHSILFYFNNGNLNKKIPVSQKPQPLVANTKFDQYAPGRSGLLVWEILVMMVGNQRQQLLARKNQSPL